MAYGRGLNRRLGLNLMTRQQVIPPGAVKVFLTVSCGFSRRHGERSGIGANVGAVPNKGQAIPMGFPAVVHPVG